MARTWTPVIGGAALALMAAALAMPAAAADTKGTLALVNGIPGTKVDVCLNGNEIKSNLAYGGKVVRDVVGTGGKNLKFYERDRRRCKGDKLGHRSFTLDPAEDLTIVVTKKAPKVIVFDNADLGEIPPAGDPWTSAPRAYRNAADLGADIGIRFWSGPPIEGNPSPSALFLKGQENALNGLAGNNIFQVQATLGGGAKVISAPLLHVLSSHRYEWIVVGTKLANARIVFLDRLTSQPS